jgi:hypothetical protein
MNHFSGLRLDIHVLYNSCNTFLTFVCARFCHRLLLALTFLPLIASYLKLPWREWLLHHRSVPFTKW